MSVIFSASVWNGETSTRLENLELITPIDPRSVLVRVTASNVSISDHLFLRPENVNPNQPLPQVLGHGGVGIVEQIGTDVDDVAVGDRVLMFGTPQCDECWFCQHGRPDWCAELQFVGPAFARTNDGRDVFASAAVGSFAELAVVPRVQVLVTESTLPDEELALLTIGFGTGVGAGTVVARPSAGATVAVVGLGACGLGYVQAARLAGASVVIGVDPVAERRERALATGATHVVDPSVVDPVSEVRRLGGDRGGPYGLGSGADFVFEASTSVKGMRQAFEMAPVTGTVVCSSVPKDMSEDVSFEATPFSCHGKTVLGNQYGGLGIRRDLPGIIALLEQGELDAGVLCDKNYSLDELPEAIDDVAELRVIGATVVPAGRP